MICGPVNKASNGQSGFATVVDNITSMGQGVFWKQGDAAAGGVHPGPFAYLEAADSIEVDSATGDVRMGLL
jgi:hypothetical protein